ncbi:CGP-CTERM sorting domain-containing protein [Thermococcus sp. GR6]|nr:CGP-CTERM sorting domain-containing protein [Thermococcus sp. GR6]
MMKSSRALLLVVIIGALLFPPAHADSASSGYPIPDYPVMMRISVASNGSLALLAITFSVYGNPPEGMCPIDSPDTYLACRELSFRDYLLFEVDDGVKYINVTSVLLPQNFTAFSPAPIGRKWFLAGIRSEYYPCHFGDCFNASYTVMEYFPSEGRIGEPVAVPNLTAETLFNFPRLLSSRATLSNGSLLFYFPYANETYTVPLDTFSPYLELLNFSDSKGLDVEGFLKLLRAVPLRDGFLVYLPTYGLVPYADAPHMEREYLLIRNESSLYISYLWVGHTGFVTFPSNMTNVPLTEELFPPVFYYHDGELKPILEFSLEHYNWSPYGSVGKLIRTHIALKLPPETRAKAGGKSSMPGVNIPTEGRAYLSVLQSMPHYSPENLTFIDFCVNLRDCLHAELRGDSLTYLKLPFPGLFQYSNGSWFYRSMSRRECLNLCARWWSPRYNGTYIYNPIKRELSSTIPVNSPGSSKERGWYHIYSANKTGVRFLDYNFTFHDVPLEKLSECVPSAEAARMLKGIEVGNGVLLYYPVYTTGVALEGSESAGLWGAYDRYVRVSLNETCILFYYSEDTVKFALKPSTAIVEVPVGEWEMKLSLPYLDLSKSASVSVKYPGNEKREESKICGPGLLVGLPLLPLLTRKRR